MEEKKIQFQIEASDTVCQIIKRENSFMDIENIKKMDSIEGLQNYYTTISNYNIPVPVLAHVSKHFTGSTVREKISILEKIVDYKNNGSSYVIYQNIDRRYLLAKEKAKIVKKYIEILLDNKLYEIVTIEELSTPSKTYSDVKQVLSYYEVDPEHLERHKKLEYASIVEEHFKNDSDKYFIFQLTRDTRLKVNKPIEVVEKENPLVSELMKASGMTHLPSEIIEEIKEEAIIESKLKKEKLNPFILETFLKHEETINIEDYLYIYMNDKLPRMNIETSIILGIKNNGLTTSSFLFTMLSHMANTGNSEIMLEKYIFPVKYTQEILTELTANIADFNKSIGFDFIELKETTLSIKK